MTSLSFFSAVSRFCVCSKRLSTVTLCCIFCCSMSLSKVCRRSVFLPNLGDQTGLIHTAAESHTRTHAQGRRDSLTYPLKFVSLLHFSPANFVVHSTHQAGTWPELSELHYPLSAINTKMMITHHKPLQMLPQLGIERNGICILNHRLCLHLCTWTKSFSFCFSRVSFLSLWTELFWRQSSFSWSSLYLHHSKDTNRINHPSYSSSAPNTPIHSLLSVQFLHFIKLKRKKRHTNWSVGIRNDQNVKSKLPYILSSWIYLPIICLDANFGQQGDCVC